MHVVATAGHVDHGKSTLLKALTGMEPDRWEEERRRGLTIDLGFVWTDLDAPDGGALTVAFVDVPGHERFVGNMLAGAGAVRLALFVVAADDGWSAQSQEHLDILHLLDIGAAIVAITKTDLAGEDRALETAAEVEARLSETSLAGAPVLLVDSLGGRGVDEVAATLARRLAAIAAEPDTGRARLWVDRAFTISGAGTVVTGTLTGSRLAVGDEARLLPGGQTVRIRGLQSLGEAVTTAVPGRRVAVNLAGVGLDEVGRGDALVSAAGDPGLWRATERLDAIVTALPGHEIGRTGDWHLHAGSAETTASLHPVLNEPVRQGNPGYVRVLLDRALPLVSGDRFVLRESGRQATLGGGVVLDPAPTDRPRGTDNRLERAADLDAVSDALAGADGAAGARETVRAGEAVGAGRAPARRLRALVDAAGGARPLAAAYAAAGLLPAHVAPDDADLDEVAGHVVVHDRYEHWSDAILDHARSHHEADPASPGPDRDELAAAAESRGCPPQLAGAIVDDLAGRGRLRRDRSAYALPEHAPARDAARERRREGLLEALMADPFAPPSLDDAAREAGVRHEELNALVQSGEIVQAGRVAFARQAIDAAVERLAAIGSERFTTAEAREALGTSRKFAVPLLEHLDALGVTEFDGQTRRLVRAPR